MKSAAYPKKHGAPAPADPYREYERSTITRLRAFATETKQGNFTDEELCKGWRAFSETRAAGFLCPFDESYGTEPLCRETRREFSAAITFARRIQRKGRA